MDDVGPAATGATPAERRAREIAGERVEHWVADARQVIDPETRKAALLSLESAIRGSDSDMAVAAMRALGKLKDVSYDKARFGDAVRTRLSDDDPRVRGAAYHSVVPTGRRDGDLELVLDSLERHPEDAGYLGAAAFVAGRRVENRLADLFLQRLSSPDLAEARDAAEQLRGMWVAANVEDAVLAVRKRDPEPDTDLWVRILGSMTPTREARVRALFEILGRDSERAPQFVQNALTSKSLTGSAATLAADFAAAALPEESAPLRRDLYLFVLEGSGTRAHAPAAKAVADNPMMDAAVRERARALAERLSRRPSTEPGK